MPADYTQEEDDYIRAHDGIKTDAEIAAALDRSPRGIENRRLRLRAMANVVDLKRRDDALLIPRSTKPTYLDQPVIKAERVLVANDVHIPFQDADFFTDVVELALAWGVTDLILGGDLLDVAAYSSFGPDPEDKLEDEMEVAEELFLRITPLFASVTWILGNHERRALGKQFERQVRANRFLRMLTSESNVRISSYEHCDIMPPSIYKPCGCRDEHKYGWKIVHQSFAPKLGGKAALDLTSGRYTKYHVICAHDHVIGYHRSADGERHAIGSGLVGDPIRMDYAMKSVANRPVMQQGAVIVLGQEGHLITPRSDFAALKKMYSQTPDAGALAA